MIVIAIKDPTVTRREVTSKQGKALTFFEQSGLAKVGDELRRIVLPVQEGQGYAPGSYTLGADSVYVDRFGRLALSPRLVPAK